MIVIFRQSHSIRKQYVYFYNYLQINQLYVECKSYYQFFFLCFFLGFHQTVYNKVKNGIYAQIWHMLKSTSQPSIFQRSSIHLWLHLIASKIKYLSNRHSICYLSFVLMRIKRKWNWKNCKIRNHFSVA